MCLPQPGMGPEGDGGGSTLRIRQNYFVLLLLMSIAGGDGRLFHCQERLAVPLHSFHHPVAVHPLSCFLWSTNLRLPSL